ncbi:hypothetical protein OIE13_31590 [Streptosporangium sp. NBC_01810]|uniref:hypothetical protein n=1 Tax=Streptosporangium sp. NBC_01810 TaxID=2975951 RepID=UPI002DDB35BC|nr:hypothetical protein [Streptosporangium sp. NBC_01810]WSA25415.1 hypothetical protein OIE13_31590 [Streptosporangium sp. NBC_01810]
MDGLGDRLLAALRGGLGGQWDIDTDGEQLSIRHAARGTPYWPPRDPPDWRTLLTRIEHGFADHAVPRAEPLPVRWGRETDLTISAVQALDPYLKHRRPYTYRRGYLPQPVVRLTGLREPDGALRDGFLTSFVNVSCVSPIPSIEEHVRILDAWLGVLAGIGLHARHIEIYGSLLPWQRGPVGGITLRFRHAGLTIGDLVLLWNRQEPTIMATDLGSGLERLGWAITRSPWPTLVHGRLAATAGTGTLDAIRTATLIAGHGIQPADRGPGYALRRLMRAVWPSLGLSTAVRHAHSYWDEISRMVTPWPEICRCLEEEVSRRDHRIRSRLAR